MKFSTIAMVLFGICSFYALNGIWGMFGGGGIWGVVDFTGERYLRSSIRIVFYVFLALFFYKWGQKDFK